MGKVSPKDGETKTPKQKRRLRNSSNRYLKPGALAQLRYNRASTAKPCTDLGKKRVAVFDSKKNHLMGTPKTPREEDCESESRLEALPMDLLVVQSSSISSFQLGHFKSEVKILCHLHHDQLKAVFHVSKRVRKAVVVARQLYFNYTTPDRSRQEMLRTLTPRPTEHWPFVTKGEGRGVIMRSPHTPKAPRHGPRPPSRMKITEMRQIAAVLFQDSAFSSRCMVPSVLSKPLCKSLASNRVLFYEDELCQAVAQNKLR
ncbi:hypothetical protein Patl1_29138 [Pistacia atlantica]|uniref:Uncharacterized protein n=1 Tax=Pistacia atlantica TaxID=434234 RepID=A0ACC1BGC6_9ROSI|nr:hypothetical protein Patl1_29138 [Pistacia atlantica]